MGCIGSRTVGGYRGGAGAGGGRARRGLVLRPPPPPVPAPLRLPLSAPPSPAALPHFPSVPSRSLPPSLLPALPSRLRALHPSGLSVPSVSLRLPSIALAQARSLSIIYPPTSSLSSVALPDSPVHAPSISRPSASTLPSPAPPRPTSISGAAPVLRTPSLSLSPESFSHAPHPRPASIWLGCFAPISFPLRCLFRSFLPPPFALFTCIFPPGRGRGEPGASGRGMSSTAEGSGAGLGWGGGEEPGTPGGGRGFEGQRGVGSPLPGGWGWPSQGTRGPDCTCQRGLAGRGGASSLFTFDRGKEERRLRILLPSAFALLPSAFSSTPCTHSALTAQQIDSTLSPTPQFFLFQLPISPAYMPQ